MSETFRRDSARDCETCATIGKSKIVLDKKFIDELLTELEKAKYSVLVCAYSWKWYDLEPDLQIQKFNTLLLKKLQQGLHIKIIVDSLNEASKFRELGFKVAVVSRDKTLHAKGVCFDNQVLALGSHNLTKTGTSDNYETTIFSNDANLVIQFIDYFYRLWAVYG